MTAIKSTTNKARRRSIRVRAKTRRLASDAIGDVLAQIPRTERDAETTLEISRRMNLSDRKTLELLHQLHEQGKLRVGKALRQYLDGHYQRLTVYWVEE